VNIGVLALQGDVREHLSALAESDVLARPIRRPEELADVDALVIPGGESTAISNLAVSFGLLDPIRKRIADGMRRNAFGRQIDSFEADVTIDEVEGGAILGSTLHAVFIRAPWVEEVGESVRVLGRVSSGPAAGRIVAVRQGNLLATAFHPELTGDLRVHRYFVEMVRAR
jgi:5'-phosphate synthase pdxT subunit